jgi:hypothetical protein
MYEATFTDSNGVAMKRDIFFPVDKFPERVPPTQVPQATPAAQAPTPAPSPTSYSLSQAAQSYAPRQAPQLGGVSPWPSTPAAAQTPGGWPPAIPQFPVPSFDVQVQKEREARIKLEAQIERERQESTHQKDMERLQQELRRVSEKLEARRGPSEEESAALKAAQEQIAKLEQQNSNQVIMQQMQAMQQQTAQMIQAMQANTDKQIEAIRREAGETKSDPMLSMMITQMQTQAQAQQQSTQMMMQVMQQNQQSMIEQARMQQQAQMSPREMIDLFRSANQGADQMANAYGKAWELMANGVESILSAQGPGVHPALAMLGQAAEGGLGIAQQYINMKEQETAANAQARTIQAQMDAQARVQAEKIRAEAATAQLQGATAPLDADGEVDEDELDGEEAGEAEVIEAPSQEEIAATEKELFGDALTAVRHLRSHVAQGKMQPVEVAGRIFQAIQHFTNQGDDMPKVFDLFKDQRFGDFVDVLLPSAPASFRQQVGDAIVAGLQTMGQQAQAAAAAAQA